VRRWPLVVLGTALLAVPGAAGAAPLRIERQAEAIGIKGYGGYLVWSEHVLDPPGYRLFAAHDGRVFALRARPRPVAFDVDVGPGPDGAPVAVYSRCRRELSGEGSPRPVYPRERHCRIYRYDLARDREQRLRLPIGAEASAILPAIWGARIAYVRLVRDGRKPSLVHVVDHGRDVAAVRLGPRGRTTHYYGPGGVTSLDLAGRTLVATWSYLPETEACGYESDPGWSNDNYQLSTYRIGGSGLVRQVLHGGCEEDGDTYAIFGVNAPSASRFTVLQRPAYTSVVSEWSLRSGARRDVALPANTVPGAYAEDGRGASLLWTWNVNTSLSQLTSEPLAWPPWPAPQRLGAVASPWR
jgi:hypothetical protein